jgi:hypothetical protein
LILIPEQNLDSGHVDEVIDYCIVGFPGHQNPDQTIAALHGVFTLKKRQSVPKQFPSSRWRMTFFSNPVSLHVKVRAQEALMETVDFLPALLLLPRAPWNYAGTLGFKRSRSDGRRQDRKAR